MNFCGINKISYNTAAITTCIVQIFIYTLKGKVQTAVYRQTSISSGWSLVPFGCYQFRVFAGFPEHLLPVKWFRAHSTPWPTPATPFSQLLVVLVNSSYQTTWLTTHKKCVKKCIKCVHKVAVIETYRNDCQHLLHVHDTSD